MPGSGLFRVNWFSCPQATVWCKSSRHSPEGVFLTGWSGRRTLMEQVFRHHRLCKQDGPLGPYIDPYAAEMRGERYSQQTSEKQIRVVADFGRWLGKTRHPGAGDYR